MSTKIGTRFLVAIEEENFDRLPGGIFNKGFVKAYARSVGVDEAEAAAEYELATGAVLPEAAAEAGPEGALPPLSIPAFPDEDPGNGASRIPWEWFAVALLIVASCFALWGFHSRDRSLRPIVPPQPAATGYSSGAGAAAAQAPATQTATAQPGSARTSAQPAQPTGNASPPPANTNTEAGQLPTSTPASSDSTSSPGVFLVQIKAREDAWVTISADGREIMQATLYASAEKSVGARDQVVIKTGNAGGLDILFNGRKLPPQGASNEVKTLTFNPNGPKR